MAIVKKILFFSSGKILKRVKFSFLVSQKAKFFYENMSKDN